MKMSHTDQTDRNRCIFKELFYFPNPLHLIGLLQQTITWLYWMANKYGKHGWCCGNTLASHRCGSSWSWVRSSARVLHVSWVCFWFSPLLRGFLSGFSGFPPSVKINIPKFQFDHEGHWVISMIVSTIFTTWAAVLYQIYHKPKASDCRSDTTRTLML
jgi:hypothetical protein